ncbi:hypothetical protein [Actinomycetospora lemnae]|uniref:Uncharacterized protein n=1 Tax=Actinomycetospora lemnae TaxID=3019891 RepID=A0ABT5SVJ1_9PSEU|nr:hypothetical protein [Actinomycetospora sp. DW7H6]MDD7966819.1 hypothetical protein [Actinomycetospora sp. DW7H6]
MSEAERPRGPVFVDATGRRRRGVTVIGYLGASAATAYLAAFGITLGSSAGSLHTTGAALTPSPATVDEGVDDASDEPIEGAGPVVEVADTQDHGSRPVPHRERDAADRVVAAPARSSLVPLRDVTPRAAAGAPRPAAAPAPAVQPRPSAASTPGTTGGSTAGGTGTPSGGPSSGGSSPGGTTTGGGASSGGSTGSATGGSTGGTTDGATGGGTPSTGTPTPGTTGTGSTTTPTPSTTVTDPATADVLAIGA